MLNNFPFLAVVTCPPLSAPVNGTMYGKDITYGAVVHFGCNNGYHLEGSQIRICSQDGTWTGEEASCPCKSNHVENIGI